MFTVDKEMGNKERGEELKENESKRNNECNRRGERKGKVDPNPINTLAFHVHTSHTVFQSTDQI